MVNDLRQLIIEILDKGYLMSLATSDAAGLWVSDVVYVHDDDFNLYWLSMPNTRHSIAIDTNSNAAASITTSNNQGEDNIGLQIAGTAYKVQGNLIAIAKKSLEKRKKARIYEAWRYTIQWAIMVQIHS